MLKLPLKLRPWFQLKARYAENGVRALLALLVCVTLSACFKPSAVVETEKRAKSFISKPGVVSGYVKTDDVNLHYMKIGIGQTLVVFVHGTPGSWTIFSPQLESGALLERAQLVAIDRPGWGKSIRNKKGSGDVLAAQSGLIGPALAKLKTELQADEVILVGHSFGASLVPRIAMDFPGLINVAVSIAGDLTDQYPATHWYNVVATWGAVSWMIPKEMQRANDEVLSIGPSLTAMKAKWAQLNTPFVVMQGGTDSLVNPKHADFAEGLKTQSQVRVVRFKKAGHLLHVTNAKEVNVIIGQLLERRERFFNE